MGDQANRASRTIHAINQLQAFQHVLRNDENVAIHALTGAVVRPASEQDDETMLSVTLPSTQAFLIDGLGYLQLLLAEQVRHESMLENGMQSPNRAQELMGHLMDAYDLND